MNELTLKKIDAAKQASDRGRQVLLVIQITCIVIFVAAWHEIGDGWTHVRLRTAQAAVWYLDCSADQHPERGSGNPPAAGPPKDKHDECHYLVEQSRATLDAFGCQTMQENPFCPDEVDRAKSVIARMRLSPAEARQQLESLRKSFIDHTITVAVPFFGVMLDVNDLGLLGGITFLLVLIWLLFSVRREAENVAAVFHNKTGEELSGIYQLLDMAQVLTIPPRKKLKGNWVARWFWICLERILFFPPFLVQLFVVWDDYRTLPRAQALNPGLAGSEVLWETGLLIAVFIVTLLCLVQAKDVSSCWEDAHKRLVEHAETDDKIFVP